MSPLNLDFHRHRRLRLTPAIRSLCQETRLDPKDFIAPIFYRKNAKAPEEMAAFPSVFRHNKHSLLEEVSKLYEAGVRAVLLFEVCEAEDKTSDGCRAWNEDNGLCEAISLIKSQFPQMIVMSDVALDAYTTHGHDGIIDEEGEILNDPTVQALVKMSLCHAQAGVDFVAPSDMMDGRIRAIRTHLDDKGFTNTAIMSYSAKYASSFYGPFRDTLGSGLKQGDKKSYQLHPSMKRAALLESLTDDEEGADILLVKPAGHYLDIIHDLRLNTHKPIAAYHVSGEYAMLYAASQAGIFDFSKALWEVTLSMKRAGADLILSYGIDTLLQTIKCPDLD